MAESTTEYQAVLERLRHQPPTHLGPDPDDDDVLWDSTFDWLAALFAKRGYAIVPQEQLAQYQALAQALERPYISEVWRERQLTLSLNQIAGSLATLRHAAQAAATAVERLEAIHAEFDRARADLRTHKLTYERQLLAKLGVDARPFQGQGRRDPPGWADVDLAALRTQYAVPEGASVVHALHTAGLLTDDDLAYIVTETGLVQRDHKGGYGRPGYRAPGTIGARAHRPNHANAGAREQAPPAPRAPTGADRRAGPPAGTGEPTAVVPAARDPAVEWGGNKKG